MTSTWTFGCMHVRELPFTTSVNGNIYANDLFRESDNKKRCDKGHAVSGDDFVRGAGGGGGLRRHRRMEDTKAGEMGVCISTHYSEKLIKCIHLSLQRISGYSTCYFYCTSVTKDRIKS